METQLITNNNKSRLYYYYKISLRNNRQLHSIVGSGPKKKKMICHMHVFIILSVMKSHS